VQALAQIDEKCHTITDILTRGLPGPKRIISQVSSKYPIKHLEVLPKLARLSREFFQQEGKSEDL
jgi:hypothetical protein